MTKISALCLAITLTAGIATTAYAAVGGDQAREANSRNPAGATTEASPATQAPHDQTTKPGYTNGQIAPTGRSVGLGTGGDSANTPLGYARGPGENSAVGKDR